MTLIRTTADSTIEKKLVWEIDKYFTILYTIEKENQPEKNHFTKVAVAITLPVATVAGEMTSSEFQNIVQTIPRQPGIYKYYDKENELLYVGKAKDLRKRVSSYFLKNLTSYKTHELVSRIHHMNSLLSILNRMLFCWKIH